MRLHSSGDVQAIWIGRAKPSISQTRCIAVYVLAAGTTSSVSEREGSIAGRVGVAVEGPVHDHVRARLWRLRSQHLLNQGVVYGAATCLGIFQVLHLLEKHDPELGRLVRKGKERLRSAHTVQAGAAAAAARCSRCWTLAGTRAALAWRERAKGTRRS